MNISNGILIPWHFEEGLHDIVNNLGALLQDCWLGQQKLFKYLEAPSKLERFLYKTLTYT